MAGIVSRPSQKEFTKLEKILKSSQMLGRHKPNVCMSIYKNRGGKYNNVKIWLDVDYSTMRISDLFVTDYEYELLPIAQNYVYVTEDSKVLVFTDKDELGYYKHQAISEMSDIEDDEEDEILFPVDESKLTNADKLRLQQHMAETATCTLLDEANSHNYEDDDDDDDLFDY